MKIITCDNSWAERWDQFVARYAPDGGLLQSWTWGEFQTRMGKSVVRLAATEDDQLVAVVQVIQMPLPLGKCYYYIPRGPIIKTESEHILFPQLQFAQTALAELFTHLKKQARSDKALFCRFDPPWLDDMATQKTISSWKFKASGHVEPKQTLILDLTKTDGELLAAMKPKTRYNIRVAQKHNIEIAEGVEYFDDFWALTQRTSERQKIKSHRQVYYKQQLETLAAKGLATLLVARENGQVITANIVTYFGTTCTYLHGASDDRHHNKMAPYLLQWQTMLRAKEKGYASYDLRGVDAERYPGITRFKLAFDPQREVTTYVGSWDDVYSTIWYTAYSLLRKFI